MTASGLRSAFGWSVVAYATAELGVGEAGRRLAAGVRASGLPTELVAATTGTLSRHRHDPLRAVVDRIGYENVISCVNADQLPALHERMGLAALRGRRTGLWFWELDSFPDRLHRSFDLVDEVWVASEFTRAAMQPHTDKPVRVVPLPIQVPTAATRFTRRALGLPEDAHVVLTSLDYLSKCERKNPMAVIRAYCDAFTPGDGACLVVKSINGHQRTDDAAAVRSCAKGRADVIFLDGYVSARAARAMIELADTCVSLHRAEGYGLNLADAMAVGTPVVATGYSGNLEFMDGATAELVGYDLTSVGPGSPPYDADAHWAEPRHDEAVAAMRRLFDDPDHAALLAGRARTSLERFSPSRVGAVVRGLLVPELAPEAVA